MAKKENRPAWFKMFGNQKALIDSVSDESVGKTIKAVFQYFDTGEVPTLGPLAFAVFSSMKPYVDESYADFEETSRKNREKAKKRWGNRNDADCTGGIQRLPADTKNTETEAEADTPYGVDASVAGKNTKNGDAALMGGPPVRFYYDPVQKKVIDRGEDWR